MFYAVIGLTLIIAILFGIIMAIRVDKSCK